jgi:isopenicillin N synthase-like dioxygenase
MFSFLYSVLADDTCPNDEQRFNQTCVAKQKEVDISVIDVSPLLSKDSTTEEKNKQNEVQISVIDISPLLSKGSTPEEKNAIKIQIGKNCRSVGMFYITNHGLESIIKEFQVQVELFFESPREVKNSVKRRANNSRGWADDEYTKRKIDTKEIFDFGHKPFENLPDDAVDNIMLDGYNQWPKSSDLEKFRSVMESYYKACSELASILLSAIAYDLGIDPIIFEDSFRKHTSFLRLNYYPIFERVEKGDFLGVNRHTDAGVLTLLMQDSNSALEVYSGTKQDNNDGEWIHVDPVEGGIAINVCDMLQVLSYIFLLL